MTRRGRPVKMRTYKAPKGYKLEAAAQRHHTQNVHVVYRKKK
jgi:hypothetical protein